MTLSASVSLKEANPTSATTIRLPVSVSKKASAFFSVSASRFAANALKAGASNTSMRNARVAARFTASSCESVSGVEVLPWNNLRICPGIEGSDARTCSRMAAS